MVQILQRRKVKKTKRALFATINQTWKEIFGAKEEKKTGEQSAKEELKRKREEKKTDTENLKAKKMNKSVKLELEESSEFKIQISQHYDESDKNSSNE